MSQYKDIPHFQCFSWFFLVFIVKKGRVFARAISRHTFCSSKFAPRPIYPSSPPTDLPLSGKRRPQPRPVPKSFLAANLAECELESNEKELRVWIPAILEPILLNFWPAPPKRKCLRRVEHGISFSFQLWPRLGWLPLLRPTSYAPLPPLWREKKLRTLNNPLRAQHRPWWFQRSQAHALILAPALRLWPSPLRPRQSLLITPLPPQLPLQHVYLIHIYTPLSAWVMGTLSCWALGSPTWSRSSSPLSRISTLLTLLMSPTFPRLSPSLSGIGL